MGGPVARRAVGPSLQHLCRREARLRAVLARKASRERQEPASGRAHSCVDAHLDGARMTDREVARALGVRNAIRYAATTGRSPSAGKARVRGPFGRSSPRRSTCNACRELAGRYIHIFVRRRLTDSPAGQGSPAGRQETHSRPSRHRCCRFDRHLATNGCSQKTSRRFSPVRRPPRPRACCRAAIPTFCSTERSGSFWSRAKISSNVSGRHACGQARSSSKARSAEPGDGRTTAYGSTPGHVSRVERATRSRPRRTPCRFQASTDRSRWFGARKQQKPTLGYIPARGLHLYEIIWWRDARARPRALRGT